MASASSTVRNAPACKTYPSPLAALVPGAPLDPLAPGAGAAAWAGADAVAGATDGGIATTPWAEAGARAGAFAAGLGACAAGANTVGGIWGVLAPLAGERAGWPDEGPDEALEGGAVSTSESDA